ncbi:MAG: hypothetical protein AAF447_15265 [Myxococcota bacterium]
MNVLARCRLVLSFALWACSSTTLLPTDLAGDAGADEGPGDPPRPDAGPDLPPLPEPITIRITDEALSPLDAEIRVATSEGTRRVTGDRVTLSSDELVERADVVVAAPGLAPFAVSTFARDDYAALPQLEGDPAIVLAPLLVTDRLEVRVSTRGGAFVSTDPLGYGSGFAFGMRTAVVQRDPAVSALILEAGDGTACPLRLPVPDLTTVESPLIVDLESPDAEEVDCFLRTLEVFAPEGTEIREAAANVDVPSRAVGYGYGVSGTTRRFAGVMGSLPPRDNVATLNVRLLPSSIATRDHPALDPNRAILISATFLRPGDEEFTTSFLRFESPEAIPDRVVLPASEPEAPREPALLIGLDLDPMSSGIAQLAAFPEAAEVVPAPEAGRSLVIGFAASGVLLPPGASVIRGRRLVREILALAGPDALIDPGQDLGFFVVTDVTASYEPFPAQRSGGRFVATPFAGATSSFLLFPRELLSEE